MACSFIPGVLDQHLPSAYVLEAPFSSMEEYITNENRLMLTNMKICGVGNVGPNLIAADLAFETNYWIRYINKPVFILHAEDDANVSYQLGGNRLFQNCSVPSSTSPIITDNQTTNHKGCYHDIITFVFSKALTYSDWHYKVMN